ncbi:MAG: hydrogenase maturation nickel metallochaperone HypA [bacterium]|nr:hydrogenase maturation nickel metallochaperone HypA [bacterium]
MHEAALAQYVIEQLDKKVQSGTLPDAIIKVYLKVGKLTAVVPDNLSFMFSVLREDTTLRNAELLIEEVPITGCCKSCQQEFSIDEMYFFCPSCTSPEVEILTGRELFIDGVEVNDGTNDNKN